MTPPRSGPPIVATAMTAPNSPMYRPRSRGLMMSAMMTWLSAARPPAPMPCTARNAMSISGLCENPAAAVASTKIAIAIWMSSLRLNRSASLPQIGVEIAVVSSVAVTTHVNAAWSPPRSWMMTGSEVETTVEASIETNMPRSRPERASSTWRCVILGFSSSSISSSFSGFTEAEEGVDMGILRKNADGRRATSAARRS